MGQTILRASRAKVLSSFSTGSTKHCRNAALNTYIGLDVHSASSTLVSIDETGEILNRRQVPTTEKHLLGFVRNEKGHKKLSWRKRI